MNTTILPLVFDLARPKIKPVSTVLSRRSYPIDTEQQHLISVFLMLV